LPIFFINLQKVASFLNLRPLSNPLYLENIGFKGHIFDFGYVVSRKNNNFVATNLYR
jgi:hypothetical protein